jgi:hypothetical protein
MGVGLMGIGGEGMATTGETAGVTVAADNGGDCTGDGSGGSDEEEGT